MIEPKQRRGVDRADGYVPMGCVPGDRFDDAEGMCSRQQVRIPGMATMPIEAVGVNLIEAINFGWRSQWRQRRLAGVNGNRTSQCVW
jgi:hypothetical protein